MIPNTNLFIRPPSPAFLTFAEARSRATQMALSRYDCADRVPCAAPPPWAEGAHNTVGVELRLLGRDPADHPSEANYTTSAATASPAKARRVPALMARIMAVSSCTIPRRPRRLRSDGAAPKHRALGAWAQRPLNRS